MLQKSMAFLALSSLLLPLQARAETAYSHLLHSIQEKYLKDAAPYPILIMDRDELEWKFANSNAMADADKRVRLIQDYIQEHTGVRVSANSATNFDSYLTISKDSPVSLPAFADDGVKYAMCAVFPPDPNGNQRIEIERLLQLNTPEAYGQLGYGQLRNTMSYDDLMLFSLLHEIAHCMDPAFLPATYSSMGDPHSIHASESFAETTAALLMVKEGRTRVTEARATLRTIYAYYMEPFFAKHPENGFGNEAYVYGGVIYYLGPSLIAAGKEIASSPERIRAMSIAEILELAKNITLKASLEQKLFTAIYAYYSEGKEVALDRYEKYAQEMPETFGETIAGLKSYIALESRTKASYFDPSQKPQVHPVSPLAPIDYPNLCSELKSGNATAFQGQLDFLRQDLRTGEHDIDQERSRSDELRTLLATLARKC